MQGSSTVVCGGANSGISPDGPEVEHVSATLAYGSGHAPEVVVLQLEIGLGAMLAVARAARQASVLVAFKPSPLIANKNVGDAVQLLQLTDVLFLNETEAITLLQQVRCLPPLLLPPPPHQHPPSPPPVSYFLKESAPRTFRFELSVAS